MVHMHVLRTIRCFASASGCRRGALVDSISNADRGNTKGWLGIPLNVWQDVNHGPCGGQSTEHLCRVVRTRCHVEDPVELCQVKDPAGRFGLRPDQFDVSTCQTRPFQCVDEDGHAGTIEKGDAGKIEHQVVVTGVNVLVQAAAQFRARSSRQSALGARQSRYGTWIGYLECSSVRFPF